MSNMQHAADSRPDPRSEKQRSQDDAIEALEDAFCKLTDTDPGDGLPFSVRKEVGTYGVFLRKGIRDAERQEKINRTVETWQSRSAQQMLWIIGVTNLAAGTILASLFHPVGVLHALLGVRP